MILFMNLRQISSMSRGDPSFFLLTKRGEELELKLFGDLKICLFFYLFQKQLGMYNSMTLDYNMVCNDYALCFDL